MRQYIAWYDFMILDLEKADCLVWSQASKVSIAPGIISGSLSRSKYIAWYDIRMLYLLKYIAWYDFRIIYSYNVYCLV